MRNSKYKHNKIVTAGTFDRLHLGHLYLLTKAFKLSRYVYIGLTDDSMIQDKERSEKIWCYEKRFKSLLDFLDGQKNYRIFRITDPYGFTLKYKGLDAILVSQETKETGKEINRKRKENNLPPVEIEAINMIKSETGERIRSTDIRKGQINREGRCRIDKFT